jgi:hypothetical protein
VGGRVGQHPPVDDDVQGAVELAFAEAVEAVAGASSWFWRTCDPQRARFAVEARMPRQRSKAAQRDPGELTSRNSCDNSARELIASFR